jgi:subtilisin family serine protease
MAVLPPHLVGRRDELNGYLLALDDAEVGIESERVAALDARLAALSTEERRKLEDAMGEWSGFAHGTGVTDIALAGLAAAEVVVARMEWWHGSPPVPCWSRELAVREAESIGELLAFVVGAGARVVNMSWSRAESAYLSNLAECAPGMPIEERRALARFTVDTIRAVLQQGMRRAPQVLFVGAAGNAGTSLEAANPATRFSLPNFLLVGAVGGTGARARFTNVGPEVTLFANGFRIPARLPGGTLSFPSGTSMAAPLVTNAAAKVLSVNPALSGAELRRLLESTSDQNATGDRLLHAARAVRAAHGALPDR